MCCPTGSAALSLDFHCLKALSLCVLWAHAHICGPTSHVSVFRCKFYSKSTGFSCEGFPCSRGWVQIYCSAICQRAIGDWRRFRLSAFVARHLHVCLRSCFCVCLYIMHRVYCRARSMQRSMWSCIHRRPVGNCSHSRFSLYRLVWPEPCGTKQHEYLCFPVSIS